MLKLLKYLKRLALIVLNPLTRIEGMMLSAPVIYMHSKIYLSFDMRSLPSSGIRP
jgi:hypothetical protein